MMRALPGILTEHGNDALFLVGLTELLGFVPRAAGGQLCYQMEKACLKMKLVQGE